MLRFVTSNKPAQSSGNLPPLAGPDTFYQLTSQLPTGQDFSFADLKGRQVLLVNAPLNPTASPQYQALQQLAAQFADELVVLVFPSHDFAEPGAAAGLPVAAGSSASLLLMQPGGVARNARQHPVFRWLSTARQNGWNAQAPPGPFTKYLVDATGRLAHYFGPTLSPLSEKVINSLREKA